MSEEFFEPPTAEEPPEPEEPYRAWAEPPPNVLGVLVASDVLLARTDECVVVLHRIVAYPSGVEMDVMVRARPGREVDLIDMFDFGPIPRRRRGEHALGDGFRMGVRLPDGSKVLTGWFGDPGEGEPRGSVLTERGGGGSDSEYHREFWLWPLPDDGTMAIAIQWKAAGIPLTLHEIETVELREAASRAVELWPDEGRSSGNGWRSVPFR